MFDELTRIRYSSRRYTDRPVEKEKVDIILEAGRNAPTARNLQPVRVLVADDDESLGKLAKAANLFGARLGLVAVADRSKAWTRPFDGKCFADIDGSIIITQMMYAATELGLGTLWIGHFDPAVLSKELDISDDEEIVSILAVGYKDDETSPNHGKRKPMSDFSYRISRIS